MLKSCEYTNLVTFPDNYSDWRQNVSLAELNTSWEIADKFSFGKFPILSAPALTVHKERFINIHLDVFIRPSLTPSDSC